MKQITSVDKRFVSSVENYFKLIPYNKISDYSHKIYSTSVNQRENVWNNFGLPVAKIEKNFKSLANERIKLAKDQGYLTYLEMILERYKIQKSSYNNFIANTSTIIEFCNSLLPQDENLPGWFYSNFNLPCFMCRMSAFPFASKEEVLLLMEKEFSPLANYKDKIIIKNGEDSHMEYLKEKNVFEITLNAEYNLRHKSVSLIHELSHVVSYLHFFKNNIDPLEVGTYVKEKEAISIQLETIRKISKELFIAHLAEILLVLRKVLFEIELYENPDQDLGKLYAKYFNLCFKSATQTSNISFMLDEKIVMTPLSNLPHAIANFDFLFTEMNKTKQ